MKENMYDNFLKLEKRVLDSISKSDLIKIKNILESIKDSTLVSGVGGSSVVSDLLAKVLSVKNNIICESITSRDILYKNLKLYKNIITCSYSGNNLGVDVSFNNNLNKYLLSKNIKEDVININYESDEEHSFISLSSTLIPMTIALLYYTNNDISLINEIFNSKINFEIPDGNIYDIMSGYETSSSAKFLESTFVESGIGIPVVHDKYDYCHGRSTLSYHLNNNLIFLKCNNELDELFDRELKKYYKNIIIISKKYNDDIVNDYYFTYLCMLLCKEIAHKQNKDLSDVKYSELSKKIYRYKGEM